MLKLCIHLCMYLSQVISRPPPLRIESDLFQCVQLGKEVQFEPAVVTGTLRIHLKNLITNCQFFSLQNIIFTNLNLEKREDFIC